MTARIIQYQAMDGKWYKREVADLIDPLETEEINKLRTANAKLREAANDDAEIILGYVDQTEMLQAANEKLQEALELIIIDTDNAEAWCGLSGEIVMKNLQAITKRAKQALKKGE